MKIDQKFVSLEALEFRMERAKGDYESWATHQRDKHNWKWSMGRADDSDKPDTSHRAYVAWMEQQIQLLHDQNDTTNIGFYCAQLADFQWYVLRTHSENLSLA